MSLRSLVTCSTCSYLVSGSCLRHTCPDCGSSVANLLNAAGELLHVC